jgi:hypothetical protein
LPQPLLTLRVCSPLRVEEEGDALAVDEDRNRLPLRPDGATQGGAEGCRGDGRVAVLLDVDATIQFGQEITYVGAHGVAGSGESDGLADEGAGPFLLRGVAVVVRGDAGCHSGRLLSAELYGLRSLAGFVLSGLYGTSIKRFNPARKDLL